MEANAVEFAKRGPDRRPDCTRLSMFEGLLVNVNQLRQIAAHWRAVELERIPHAMAMVKVSIALPDTALYAFSRVLELSEEACGLTAGYSRQS